MLLIIGGAYQGKLDFALELTGYERADFADGASCGQEELYSAKGIHHFHEYIRRLLEQENAVDADAFAEEIRKRNPDLVIVTNELGYGIVPVDPKDRLWRETAGRVCTRLAGEAKQVYRVVCGLGMPLTGR
ncbi:MAG: bifunctional adenosylcobinamide kinase/adenosylcobinamide-phosphate guanylyltransferase [Lachnospiraceae bacterium]|nr:bifunctional adenosylcobinamide kinase/adenosylcobinamide-phosphate guanylyltransferase [Lachnospiraceae bacterium]